jgi:hypothetical protein
MAARKRRTPAINTDSVSAHIPDGAWDDFSSVAPEPTHEEMLEIAEEREAEEEAAVEVFLAMAAADTFEALQKAEEEKGLDGFFDPDFYKQEIRLPAQPSGYVQEPLAQQPKRRPRHILRKTDRRRKG